MGLGGGMALLAGKLQLARLPPSSSSSCCQQHQHQHSAQHQHQQQQNQQAGLSLVRRHGGGTACPSVRAQRKAAPLLAVSDDDVVITSVRELADGSFHYAFGAGASPPPPQPSKRGDDLASSRAQHVLTPAPLHLPQRPPSRFRKHSPIPVRAGRTKGGGKEKQEQVQQQEQMQEQEVRRVVWRKAPGVPVRPKSAFVKRSPIPSLTSRPRCPVSLPAPLVLDDAVEEQPDESLPVLPPPPPVSPPFPSPPPPPPLLVVNGVAREQHSDNRVPKAAEVSGRGGSKKAEAASKSGKGASAAATAESPVMAVQLPAADHSPAPAPDAAAAAPSPSRPASKFVRKSPIPSQARNKSLQEPVVEARSLVQTTVVESNVVESKGVESNVVESKVVESNVVESKVVNSTVVESKVVESAVVESAVVESTVEERTLEIKGAGAPVQGLVGEDSSQGSSSSKGGSSSAEGGSGSSKGSSGSSKGSSSSSKGSSSSTKGSSSSTKESSGSSKGNSSRSSSKSNVEQAKEEEVVELPPIRPKSNFFRRSPIPRRLTAKLVQEVKVEPLQQRPPAPAPAPARRSPKKSAKEAATNAEPKTAVEEGKAPVDQDPETGSPGVQDPQAEKPGDQLPADLAACTLVQLRGIAKARGLKGYSRLKKAELIALLQQ